MSAISGGYIPEEGERITCDEPGHVQGCLGVIGGDHEVDPEWEEDEEGYVTTRLSYENREGDPAFNGAFDRW